MMYSTRPTLPTDKQAHVKRDELPNPMCRRNTCGVQKILKLYYAAYGTHYKKLSIAEKPHGDAAYSREMDR